MFKTLDIFEPSKKIFSNKSLLDNGDEDLSFVNKISKFLVSIIKENKKLANYEEMVVSKENNIFNTKVFTRMPLKDFLIFLHKYNKLEDCIWVTSIIYLERFCEKASVVLTEFNVHKLLFVSLVLSLKLFEDINYNNAYYSNIIGINNKEMNYLEYLFLTTLDFKLNVSKSEYNKYKKYIDNFTNKLN